MRKILILTILLLSHLSAFAAFKDPPQPPSFIKKLQITKRFVEEAVDMNCHYNSLKCLILNQDIALISEYFQMLKQGKTANDLIDDPLPIINEQSASSNTIPILGNYVVLTINNKNGSTNTVYVPNNLNLQQQREYLIKRNSILRDLFAANESINRVDSYGFTSLHYAAATNSNQMIDLLISFGAKAYSTTNEFKLMPVAVAAIVNSNLVIEKLMNIGGRENIDSSREYNLLSYYCSFGKDVTVLDQIYNFNFGTSNLNIVDKYGNSPAFYAALANNPNFLQYLIKTKLASPNIVNEDGKTMLIYSVEYNCPEATTMLLDLKADPNIEDYSHRTAISYAIINQDYFIAKQLFKDGAKVDIFDRQKMSPLFYAIQTNNPYVLEVFLTQESLANSRSPDGYNLLSYALTNRFYEVANFLVTMGYNINEAAPDSLTPLMLAAGNGQLGLVQNLIAKGANIDAKSKTNNTALSYSLSSTQADSIAVFLIEHGADPFIINNDGMTASAYAGINRKGAILLAIIEQKPEFKFMLSQGKLDELSLNICTYLTFAHHGPCLYNVKDELASLKNN